MGLDEWHFQQYARQQAARAAAVGETEGALFFVGDAAGTVHVPAGRQAQPGEVYVKRMVGGNLEVTSVLNPFNVALVPGAPVIVGRAPNSNQYVILRAAVQAGAATFGGGASAGVGPHAAQHAWGGGDTPPVDLRQLTAWALAPQEPPDMTVRVLGGLYQDGDRLRWQAETATADLSGYCPATPGNALWLAVLFDPATAALAYLAGAAFEAGSAVEAGLAAIDVAALPAGARVLGLVHLAHGQAAVDWPHLRPRPWPGLVAGVADAGAVAYTPAEDTDWDGDADPGNVDAALDQLAARVDDIETAGAPTDASAVTYAPADDADWDGDADPGNVDDALDQLAARVDDIETAGAPTDASAVTYTPAQDTDWDGDADPGNADAALDQLAARVDDLEATAHTVYWSFEGELAEGASPLRLYNRSGVARTIAEVFLAVHTAPAGAAVIVDVHKDGTTIFTNQSNRPQIAAGNDTGASAAIDDPAWPAGAYLTAEIDQVGASTPGSDLVVHVTYI
ncbi:MAG: hypothetical protein M5R40_06630 [Anaerolineae bacterium]|nr:hypothetical protein [Anaerolineae bacterium]